MSVDHDSPTPPGTARGSALERDAAIAANRLRAALERHGLADGRAFPELGSSLNGQGRPVVTLGEISPDTALALADLLDGIRPFGT